MPAFAQKPNSSQHFLSPKPKTMARPRLKDRLAANATLDLYGKPGTLVEQSLRPGSAAGLPTPLGHHEQPFPANPPQAPVLQTKLTINKPGDAYEQEADRVAEQVMRTSAPKLQRACACGGWCLSCQSDRPVAAAPILQAKPIASDAQGSSELPSSVLDVLHAPGRRLDTATRAFMEPRFGRDFSDVRVHTDGPANASARAVNARAYTVGRDVVFDAGQYAPNTAAGQRLLAHELTHVVQQSEAMGPKPTILMCQRRSSRRQQARPVNFQQRLYVVRDSEIGMGGGELVADLVHFKAHVMSLSNNGIWTLVLAIHGSLDRIAAQAPPDWQHNAVFYEASDITALFNNDPAWVQWRDAYGPSHLSLVSCQVSRSFEAIMINNLTRHVASGDAAPAPSQSARGMGTHCKPLSNSRIFEYPAGNRIQTRQQHQRLSQDIKDDMARVLANLNLQYGYYGAPPVAESQIFNFYFDEAPRGAWAIVTVGVEQAEGEIEDSDIPFWNRTTGLRSAEFRRLCDQGLGRLRERTPRMP